MFKIPKNTFKNKDKALYVAIKDKVQYDDYNNPIIEYNTPEYLGRFNYQPLSGNDLVAYISAYGETTKQVVRLFLDTVYKNKLKEFDLAYLYGTTPSGEIHHGDNANYRIRTIKEQNTVIMVILEEIIKESEHGTN